MHDELQRVNLYNTKHIRYQCNKAANPQKQRQQHFWVLKILKEYSKEVVPSTEYFASSLKIRTLTR
uniref:Uncharacterized protein n=1 Tax=Oryza punctata TaxID=4537 RepID=A0A0E0LQB6_ORYPU